MTTRINRAAIERTYGLITPYFRVTPVLLSGAYAPAPGECVGVVVSRGNSTAVDFDR